MTLFKKMLGAAVAMTALALVVLPATADTTSTQVIDASIGTSISMTTTPSATIGGWTLAASGANTTAGGTMAVQANTPYKVTVKSDKATMTEFVTGSSAYETASPKSLTTPISVVTALTAGAGIPVPTLAVGTTTANIATGTGLTTDTYSVTLSQPTVISDVPLAAGRTYHIVLTYTATSAP
jgi:hypothetical protein